MKLGIGLLSLVCVAVLAFAFGHQGAATAHAAAAAAASPSSVETCASPDAVAPEPAAVLQLDAAANGTFGKCVPSGGSCKGPGKKCCGYCCSGTCRKHANCKD